MKDNEMNRQNTYKTSILLTRRERLEALGDGINDPDKETQKGAIASFVATAEMDDQFLQEAGDAIESLVQRKKDEIDAAATVLGTDLKR